MGKILVIEDDRVLNETICDILQVNGYNVESAHNGLEGLEYSSKKEVDLVICDVNMPIMNGLETIQKFRSNKKNSIVPFLFLSARSTSEDINDGLNRGADDYMTKPFHHEDLIMNVERLLKKHAAIKDYFTQEIQTNVHAELDSYKQSIHNKVKHHFYGLEEAKCVQNIILPKGKELKSLIPDYSLFYQPKERISGDFYWVKKVGSKTLVAVGDCTGHGIPAALMTMICTTILSSTVDHFGLTRPKDILNKTNQLLCEYTASNKSIISYGMDVALCSIDYKNLEVIYSGAMRPLYVVSKTEIEASLKKKNIADEPEDGVNRVKGNLLSIGSKDQKRTFEEYTFNVNKGDSIFLSSDGFADQFGGEKGKKFSTKRLKCLFSHIFYRNSKIQEIMMEDCFSQWKEEKEQIDDVTVLGINF